ncbi:MAG: hypothetical protein NT154_10930, partial [Verrucomicrobia bacterium]|nr:hypothetical protein [Verrucomicrobiota bacterium]
LIAAQAPPAASHPSSVIVRQSSVISQQPPVTSPPILLDWSPMIEAIMADLKASVPVGQISARFHNALVEGIIAIAKRVGQTRIVLSGGCFQNRYLTERSVRRLQAEGFRPYWHQRIPPNDGGIALGQAVAALRQFGDTHLC